MDLDDSRLLRLDELRRTIEDLRSRLPPESPLVALPSLRLRDRGEMVPGMPIPFGLASFAFHDTQYGDYGVVDHPHIYAFHGTLQGRFLQSLLPPLEAALQAKAPVVLVADDVDESILAFFAMNRRKGSLMGTVLLPDRLAGENPLATFAALTQSGLGRADDEGISVGNPGSAPRLLSTAHETVVLGPLPMLLSTARVGLVHVGGDDPAQVQVRTRHARAMLAQAMN